MVPIFHLVKKMKAVIFKTSTLINKMYIQFFSNSSKIFLGHYLYWHSLSFLLSRTNLWHSRKRLPGPTARKTTGKAQLYIPPNPGLFSLNSLSVQISTLRHDCHVLSFSQSEKEQIGCSSHQKEDSHLLPAMFCWGHLMWEPHEASEVTSGTCYC